MKQETSTKMSAAALACGSFPLLSGLLQVLHVPLSGAPQLLLAGADLLCTLAGLGLAAVCVKERQHRNFWNLSALALSAFWLLLMMGIGLVALFLNFL